jgi:hypothetical protein
MNLRRHLNNTMSIIKRLCALFILLFPLSVSAQFEEMSDSQIQTADTTFVSFDSLLYMPDSSAGAIPDTLVRYDDTQVDVRKTADGKIDDLKQDPDLDYTITPTVESVWSRILWFIASLFLSMLSDADEGGWLKYLIWGIGIAILMYVIMRLLKIDALRVFYSGEGKSITYTALDENIHEMDFDKLISKAVAAGDYRLAIRLQFLQALKILSDKHLIHWQPGKTNHDYMMELGKSNLRTGFTELNEYFEYAWYGNFPIAPELFGKVQNIFNTWRRQA